MSTPRKPGSDTTGGVSVTPAASPDRVALRAALARAGAVRPGASGVASTAAARIGKDGTARTRTSMAAAGVARDPTPRLVFALDATASRERAWTAARATTDSLFPAAGPGIEVALAVHSGGRMTRFSPFMSDLGALRDEAAAVECVAGPTCMLDILRAVLHRPGVRAVVYVGDSFEESEAMGLALADTLRLRGIRLVVLHDRGGNGVSSDAFFHAMAARTGGCVLPFDASSLSMLRDALSAVASYVSGGMDRLRSRSLDSPAARLMLEDMSSDSR